MVSIPSLGIARRSTTELAGELRSRGLPLSAPLPTFPSRAKAPHGNVESPTRLLSPCRGRRCSTGDNLHRRSAIAVDEPLSHAPPLPFHLYPTRLVMGSTLVPSVSPGTSPSASFTVAAPSSSSVPCFLSLTHGSHLPVTAAERKPELGCAVLGCVLAQSWAVFPLPCARAAQAKCGRGPADSSGLAQ